ncbi:hypothetical protein QTP70_013127 [Hemibagrus guttatus]|uniref:Reverse transcriptase domain-containing protein n=1 Tax=Hemibagrus guttatus TaxID=175788 RepID=A0AAE0VAZ7_9TELE|nr:hypothetical protein QTP70_013127 [Hemibagrus guttatus]
MFLWGASPQDVVSVGGPPCCQWRRVPAAPSSHPPAPWGVPDPSETDIVAPEPSFVGGHRSVRVLGGGRFSALLLGGGRRLALLLGGGRRLALLLGCGCRSAPPLSCGPMLQTISPELLPFITTVINGSLTSGHIPTVFKKARVIPILKKPALDPSDISNYRPNNLHDPNQSGFKAAHSTETALLAVTEKLHAARSAKLSAVLILLNLSAAFDTVNHKTLLSTLRSLGICGTAWEWFASYLDGRSYQMKAHQLKLNPSKTELLIIPGDPSPAQDLAISLNNSMISPSATARNLGVTMANQLSFSCPLLYNIKRIRPFLSTQATQVLVQSLVISRLDYCNSLLAGLPLNAIRPLQMIQNAAARLVFNLPKFSHTTPLLRSLHWLPVAARIRFKTLMLAYKAKNGPAPSYLKALVTPRTAPRSLRSTSTARLVPPSLREKGCILH